MSFQPILVSSLLSLVMYNQTLQSDLSAMDRLGDVAIKNSVAFSSEEIKRIVGIRRGQAINDEVIEKAVELIKKAYLRRGFVEIKASIRKDIAHEQVTEKNRIVNLQITIDEGPRFYIRRTELEGNQRTNHNVVMRAAGGLRPNQPYDPEQVEKWVRGLNRLGRFESVKKEDIEIKIDKQGQFVDVLFHLKEKPGLKIRRN